MKSYRDYTADDITTDDGATRDVKNTSQYYILTGFWEGIKVYAYNSKLDAIRAFFREGYLEEDSVAALRALEKRIIDTGTDRDTGPLLALLGVNEPCEGYWHEFIPVFRQHSYDALTRFIERWSSDVAWGSEEDAESANESMDEVEAHDEWLTRLPADADLDAPETVARLLDYLQMLSW